MHWINSESGSNYLLFEQIVLLGDLFFELGSFADLALQVLVLWLQADYLLFQFLYGGFQLDNLLFMLVLLFHQVHL